MSEPLRTELDLLHQSLVSAFGGPRTALRARMVECLNLTGQVAFRLQERTPTWDDALTERCLSAIVLLDHLGMGSAADKLREVCQQAAGDAVDPVTLARFVHLALLTNTRRGTWGPVTRLPVASPGLPEEVSARLEANLVLSSRHDRTRDDALTAYLWEPAFAGGSVAHFALTSLAFDDAVYSARLPDARAALARLEQLAAAIMADLGEDHPYLGLVLLTLSAAKCAHAAVEGNGQDMRRYVDVLAVAVQRASAQLGPEHAQTLGGMANLAHAEFEIALASRSLHEVRQCVENLDWLEEHAASVMGLSHPTVVVLAMNAAVARLEHARQERRVTLVQQAETRLREVARRCEERFGSFHPCTAIARSNAASAGFDLARARRSRPELEHMVTVLEDTVSQVSNSLGAGHATARALTRQLRACHRLLAGDTPWTEGSGGTGTIVRTIEDEAWGLDDDYVPVYEASTPAHRRRRRRDDQSSAIEVYKAGSAGWRRERDDEGAEDSMADRVIEYLREGDFVECVVVRIEGDEVLARINQTLAVLPAGEMSAGLGLPPILRLGDEIETVVLHQRDAVGRVVLSLRQARLERAWERIKALEQSDEPVKGKVVAATEDGLVLDLGLRAFLPAVLVETGPARELRWYVGRELVAKIVETDRSRDKVILSRRAWLEQTRSATRGELVALERGELRDGVVSSVVNFGAYVDLGGVRGLVPVSELSWSHFDHPSEVVAVGQEVTAEVLAVDLDLASVTLSLKATEEDPWRRFVRDHTVGQFVLCTVTRLAPFGAFVRVAEGIEGLVDLAELAEDRLAVPEQAVRAGDKIVAEIIGIFPNIRRVALSLKRANEIIPDADRYAAREVYERHVAQVRAGRTSRTGWESEILDEAVRHRGKPGEIAERLHLSSAAAVRFLAGAALRSLVAMIRERHRGPRQPDG